MEFDQFATMQRDTSPPETHDEAATKARHSRPSYTWKEEIEPNKGRFALFCFEDPASPIGQRAARTATALARRGNLVHLLTARPFNLAEPRLREIIVGETSGDSIVTQVNEFAGRAFHRFLRDVGSARSTTLLGFEWSSIPALSMLHSLKKMPMMLSLQSFERRRSDMTGELSQRIEEIECTGLREAKRVFMHDAAAAGVATQVHHECKDRLVTAYEPFAIQPFSRGVDAGEVKARYQVGPVDPMILYVGDLADHYGPDLIMKAMPVILKNQKQARFVIVGYGDLYWPLRVHARYLLLEHAVRMVGGDLPGQDVADLIAAADVVVCPSRAATPWWPIQAAWAAKRPVAATHEAAPKLLQHEHDSVLFYPNVNSCVWGVEKVLFDQEFAKTIAKNGHAKLDEQFGWNMVAQQIESEYQHA